jgi:hypothetical protein
MAHRETAGSFAGHEFSRAPTKPRPEGRGPLACLDQGSEIKAASSVSRCGRSCASSFRGQAPGLGLLGPQLDPDGLSAGPGARVSSEPQPGTRTPSSHKTSYPRPWPGCAIVIRWGSSSRYSLLQPPGHCRPLHPARRLTHEPLVTLIGRLRVSEPARDVNHRPGRRSPTVSLGA